MRSCKTATGWSRGRSVDEVFTRMEEPMKGFVAGLLIVMLVAGTAATSMAATNESTGDHIGYGAGSMLATLVYSPIKASVCILGGIGSLFALPFGKEKSGNVIATACGGTWVISPDALKGQEQIAFIGHPGLERRAGGDQIAGGDHVKAAQQALKNRGFDPGDADGRFGPKTTAALREFQKQEGLTVSGRLDRETLAKLGVEAANDSSSTTPSASPSTTVPDSPKG
jgi:putative peptidoglycan binding protein